MELCLHQVRGRAAPLSVTLRQCTREEAETVYRLQNEVRAMMPNPELFMPDTLENIQSYLEHDLCLGAWDGERLGAYFILRYCGHSEHNYAAFMGIPEAEWEHWANADSVIVHRTGGAMACSASCWKTRCRCFGPASWALGPPSAPATPTA